ncbi:MAG: hypothetical protein ACR2OV_18145 [Hyphomicrobiaceae bacterium]
MARLNWPTGRNLVRSCLGLSFLAMAAVANGQPLQADSEPAAGQRDRMLFTGAFRYTPPAAPNTEQIRQRIISGPLAVLQLDKEEVSEAIPPLGPVAYVEPETIEMAPPFRFFVLPASLEHEPNPLIGQPSIGKIVEEDGSIADEIREARLTIGGNAQIEAQPQLPEAHPHRKRRVASLSNKKRTVRRSRHSSRWTKRYRNRRVVAATTTVSTVYANANLWARSAFTAKN